MTTYELPDSRLVISQPCELVSLFPGLDIDGWSEPQAFNAINGEVTIPSGTKGIVLAFHGTGYSYIDHFAKMNGSEDSSHRILQVQVLLDDGRMYWFPSRCVKGL